MRGCDCLGVTLWPELGQFWRWPIFVQFWTIVTNFEPSGPDLEIWPNALEVCQVRAKLSQIWHKLGPKSAELAQTRGEAWVKHAWRMHGIWVARGRHASGTGSASKSSDLASQSSDVDPKGGGGRCRRRFPMWRIRPWCAGAGPPSPATAPAVPHLSGARPRPDLRMLGVFGAPLGVGTRNLRGSHGPVSPPPR